MAAGTVIEPKPQLPGGVRTPRDPSVDGAVSAPDRALRWDVLEAFLPWFGRLGLGFAIGEGVAAVAVSSPTLGVLALLSLAWALIAVVGGRLLDEGRTSIVRLLVAVSTCVLTIVAAWLVPDLGTAIALVPILSIVLVLPADRPEGAIAFGGTALAATTATLLLGGLSHPLPAIPGELRRVVPLAVELLIGGLFLAALLRLAGHAQSSLAALRHALRREERNGTERIAIVASLHRLTAEATPEATAATIARALGQLPNIRVAGVLEVEDDGLAALAVIGDARFPLSPGGRIPAGRARYLLANSAHGPWAELWTGGDGGDYAARLSEIGIRGQAYAPIRAGDAIVALIAIATTDEEHARHLVRDLPAVTEFASIAGAILAPALAERRELRATRRRIEAIIAHRAFGSVFQPIVDLATGSVVGFEALTRFQAGLGPDVVFADATRSGLTLELEAVTLATALEQARSLPAGAWLSLNVSPGTLADGELLARLLQPHDRPVILEVTEHETIADYAGVRAAVGGLRPRIRLAVDDAGAGIANFAHLVELRPDVVKIDAGLVRDVDSTVSRQALVVGLVHFAKTLGAMLVAEGIETDAERATVERLGVTLGQGYLLARPAPVESWAAASPSAEGEATSQAA